MPEAKPTPGAIPKKPETQPKSASPQVTPAPDQKADGKAKAPEVKAPPTTPKKPTEKPKAPEPKAAPTTGNKKPEEKPKAPDSKAVPTTEPKKPEEIPKAPEPKAAPITEKKEPDGKPIVPEPKAAPATGPKKPEEKPKAPEPKAAPTTEKMEPDGKPKVPDPKAAPATGPKKPGEKPKAPEPKAAPTNGDKKPEEKPKVPDPKVAPAAEPKKPEEKSKAPAPKAAPINEQKAPDDKPAIAVSGKEMKEIPIDKPAEEKDAPAADPKAKDTAVEPPKGVKITQIFDDRLDKPTQKDLESLPIPGEGEGFSMRLHPAYFFEFLDHPFSVNRETDDYRELFDSIKENGINEPIKARPREKGGLELISGHRRHDVAMQLNYPVPVVIVRADDDSAQIECVDGNLHRKDIPTSELARAAKMKLEAMGRKVGRRSKMDQLAAPQKRTDQLVAEEMGYSRTQLTRLVRIDSLIPELKQMVDSKKVPFNLGVELSYMNPQEQKDLVSVMNREQTVPSLSQAQRMKEESQKAAKAAKEAAKAPKPALQIVSPKQPEPAANQTGTPAADNAGKTPSVAPTQSAPAQPVQATPAPAPEPAPKPPAPVDAKKFASIMKNKPEPELKVIFTGAELKSYFPGQTPTVPEVKRAVFDALDLRKKALEKQAKKQEVTNPTR